MKQLQRFGAGVLRIDSVQLSDTGVYVCVWNTTTSHNNLDLAYVNLTVIGMCSSSNSSSSSE